MRKYLLTVVCTIILSVSAFAQSGSGAIRVHMSSLRKKLKAVLGYDPIVNKVGEGYKMREESEQ